VHRSRHPPRDGQASPGPVEIDHAWPSLVAADDHVANMQTLLRALPDDLPRRGVVHVGAHRAEEVPVFRQFGFEQAVLIEANPGHAAALRDQFAGDPTVSVVASAVGDRNGVAQLLVHTSRRGSTEPASLLPLLELQRIVPTLTTPTSIDVPIATLDELWRRGLIDPMRHNLLVVDVQGAEAMVFGGGRAFTATLDAIITEVNVIPLYEGVVLEGKLLAELTGQGFTPRQSVYHELFRGDDRFVAWGECLLVRDAYCSDTCQR
jgi:FkbM family methyltransferase